MQHHVIPNIISTTNTHLSPVRRPVQRWPLAVTVALAVALTGALFLFLGPRPIASAQAGIPDLRYVSSKNQLLIGRPYSDSIPAEAPFIGAPNKDGAPKLSVNLRQIQAFLAGKTYANDVLVYEGDGIWFLKASLSVEQNAKLELIGDGQLIKRLRLESTDNVTETPTVIVIDGGQLAIDNMIVHSWNPSANNGLGDFDKSYQGSSSAPEQPTRSFILASNGARMDISNSELSYLGWEELTAGSEIGKGEGSGIAWRLRATEAITESSPRGSLVNSRVHHNYFGLYAFQAHNINITGNEIKDNVQYGISIQGVTSAAGVGASNEHTISQNKISNNGSQAIVLSRRVSNSKISNNEISNNAGHGIYLDRESDNNQVFGNAVLNNSKDGILIFQSSNNQIRDNLVRDNGLNGLRVSARYNNTDSFDTLAVNNEIRNNRVLQNADNGLSLLDRSDRNTVVDNIISKNSKFGVYINAGGNVLRNNVVAFSGKDGIFVTGAVILAGGLAPLNVPGVANIFDGNVVEFNSESGIAVETGNNNKFGETIGNEVRANRGEGIRLTKNTSDTLLSHNVVHLNTKDGIYLNGTTSIRNRISENSISLNGGVGISRTNANGNAPVPSLFVDVGPEVSGFANQAGVRVEVYRDAGREGMFYKGFAISAADNSWKLTLPANDDPKEGKITVLAIYQNNNTSEFKGLFGADPIQAAAVSDEAEVNLAFEAMQAKNTQVFLEDMQIPADSGDTTFMDKFRSAETAAPSTEDASGKLILLPMVSN